MITDEVFTKELEQHLKAQGLKKADRVKIINNYLVSPKSSRDLILDKEGWSASLSKAEKVKKELIPTEFSEQCDVVAWFKRQYPNVVIMSIRNGGYRKPSERQAQLLEGLHVGAGDLFIPEYLLWVEMKRVKGSVWSAEQKEFKKYVESIGQTYVLCYGADDAKNKIKEVIECASIIIQRLINNV